MNNRLAIGYWFAGVYLIENITNGKKYVGSSQSIELRIKNHKSCLLKGTHHCKEMQQDYNNGDKFIFKVLYVEAIQPNSHKNRQRIYQIEKRYIEKFSSGEKGYKKIRVHGVLKDFCQEYCIESDGLQAMAEAFFDVESSDHNINHFATAGILEPFL